MIPAIRRLAHFHIIPRVLRTGRALQTRGWICFLSFVFSFLFFLCFYSLHDHCYPPSGALPQALALRPVHALQAKYHIFLFSCFVFCVSFFLLYFVSVVFFFVYFLSFFVLFCFGFGLVVCFGLFWFGFWFGSIGFVVFLLWFMFVFSLCPSLSPSLALSISTSVCFSIQIMV